MPFETEPPENELIAVASSFQNDDSTTSNFSSNDDKDQSIAKGGVTTP
jgi:hypothetical protein